MSPPPFYHDWWLAAALTSTALPMGFAQAADVPTPPVGVVTMLSSNNISTDGSSSNTVYVGSNIMPGMHLQTNSEGPLHILFLDQSALTLGPDSELTIDEFSYDADTQQGRIHLGLSKGLLRIVGGHISKNNAAIITTPYATVEILGGITLVSVSGGTTQSTFLFGQQMRVGNSGGTQTVTRPGFLVNSNNGGLSSPTRMESQALTNQLVQLERTQARLNQPSSPPEPLVSLSDRPGSPRQPEQQLAPDRVRVNSNNTQQANPTLVLNNLLTSSSSTIQS